MNKTADPDLSLITILPGQRSGQPCIRGLRVTVWDVLDMLASGVTEEEILEGFLIWRRPISPLFMPMPRNLGGNENGVEASF